MERHLTGDTVRAGISAGLRMDIRLRKHTALSFGVDWNHTAGNLYYQNPVIIDRVYGLDTLGAGASLIYRMQYLEIPVALKFFLPEIGYTTLFCEAGLDPMFNTGATLTQKPRGFNKESFVQGVAHFNLAYHAGIGFIYSFGEHLALQVLALYENTFLDVTRENEVRTDDNTRLNQVGLSVGLIF